MNLNRNAKKKYCDSAWAKDWFGEKYRNFENTNLCATKLIVDNYVKPVE